MAAPTVSGFQVAVALALAGCAHARPQNRDQPPDIPGRAAAPAATAEDAAALVAQGEAANEAGRYAEAVALLGRVLAGGPDDPEILRRTYLGLGSAHEHMRDCAGAVRAYAAHRERFPTATDAPIVAAHEGACLAELGRWDASAARFAAVAAADGQLPSTQIEALARQGYALFNLDRFDDADRVLARADEVFVRAERDQSERFSTYYFVGMARFYRAAIVHRRFREIEIVLPEKVMAKRFKRKLELLVAAQEAYNAVIKAKHVFWVSAAGFQLGHMFGEFYDALMYAPVPSWLDERQRRTYYDELKKQLRPVIDKAVWVLEKNLETARRLGYESEFIAQTEAKLGHLQSVLASDEPGLGRPLPRLVPEEVAELAPVDVPRGVPGDNVTDRPTSAADRKLFVPPMTAL